MAAPNVRNTSDVAVFARNYREHLNEAADIAEKDPTRPIPFRSGNRWVSAKEAIAAHGPRRIYFAVVDAANEVEYEASLDEIVLNPSPGDRRVEELLKSGTKTTETEGLWDSTGQPKAQTLYVISGCKRLSHPIPITELRKLSDGSPIDANFQRNYAIVYRLPQS